MGERVLHLVRHGQYHREPERLTDIGRAQAEIVAARIVLEPIASVRSSTAPRAKETAAAISRLLPALKPTASGQLVELIPSYPRHELPDALQGRPIANWSRDLAQLDRACEMLFKPTRGPDRVEVVVIHGNLIRALVCRALRAPIGMWWDMWIDNCSVTTLRVRKDRCFLMRLNDTGHLPPALVTAQ